MCLVLVWDAWKKNVKFMGEGVGSLLVSAARNVCLATPSVCARHDMKGMKQQRLEPSAHEMGKFGEGC